ncbi:MAG: hypothetical protein ABSB35_34875 [Bryobacteraceae bacterium]
MRRIHVSALAVAAVLAGCHSSERSGACVPIGAATRVVVHVSLPRGTEILSDRIVTDPERIRELTGFANARREASRPQLYTMPAPQMTAAFYDKADFLGSIGTGPNFFFVSCPNWNGVRRATDAEVRDFERLIGDAN